MYIGPELVLYRSGLFKIETPVGSYWPVLDQKYWIALVFIGSYFVLDRYYNWSVLVSIGLAGVLY